VDYFLIASETSSSATVHDGDGADTLGGDGGRDWFFANLTLDDGDNAARKDRITDLSANELTVELDDLFAP
jgi:hypothetical protein